MATAQDPMLHRSDELSRRCNWELLLALISNFLLWAIIMHLVIR